MSIIDQIYAHVPVPIQNLGISAFGLGWYKRRYGGVFEQELSGFKQREGFSEAQFEAYQTLALRRLLLHAYASVPYYHQSFKSNGVTSEQLSRFELSDLPKLPFLDKTALRSLGTTELLAGRREKNGAFFGSSGSTGTPVQILFSHPMHQRWMAGYEARVRHWAGVTRFDRRGMIGGRRIVPDTMPAAPFYRYNFVEKQVYFSAYHINTANTRDYLAGLQKHRPVYLTGYAQSNFFLARFLEAAGLQAPPLKAILPSSEALTQEMRDTFLRVYGCKAYDAWSGVEACGLVSTCPQGQLHISPDIGILEFLNLSTGKAAAVGDLAEVYCTGLLNVDQPLIRYRIGDLMRLSKNKCSCGRAMPVVEEIIGRLEDVVTGPNGQKLLRFHGVFLGIPTIIEGQVIQHTLYSYELKTVSTCLLTKAEVQLLKSRMISLLGNVSIAVSEVGHIERSANGKFKSVVSHVSDN